MQNFPQFEEKSFIKTREQIHAVAEVIGKFREKLVKPIAKNDNLWLSVVEQGFCTPPIDVIECLELGCNLEKLIVEVADDNDKYFSLNINGKTPSALGTELKSVLSNEFKVGVEVDSNSFDSTKTLAITQQEAGDFLIQLSNFNLLLYDFWDRIESGVKTKICLWPHHFDNAFKWFSGRKIDEQDEQMGIGVSNGDETYALPYIYMTLWPEVRKTNTLETAEGAILHEGDWTGFVLPYESIAGQKTIDEQKAMIDDFFGVSFASIQKAFSKR
ncbi:MAG: DUF5996 family protein [Chlorobi bacterium]|nr:DUF5996 family protein [Chlorobiota bacterium]MCI0716089.1 DUF5996 family protein [Chlorobiota bacterium]